MYGRHYQKESTAFLAINGVSAYLKKAEEWLRNEEANFASYSNCSSTGKLLIERCGHILISEHLKQFGDIFPDLLDPGRKEDLVRMFGLLARIEGSHNNNLKTFHKTFELYVANEGLAALSNLAIADDVEPSAYVDTIFEVWHKYSEISAQCFPRNVGLVASIDRACQKFINRNAVTKDSAYNSLKLLVDYADDLLRNKTMTPEEIEEALHKVVCNSSAPVSQMNLLTRFQ